MSKCQLCQYEYQEEANYCPRCGVKLSDQQDYEYIKPEWSTAQELLEVSRALSSTLDLQILLEKIDAAAVKLTGAMAGSIMLLDDKKEALRFRSTSGVKVPVVNSLLVQDGIAWWVSRNGQIARVDDAQNDSRYTGTIDKITGFKTENVLCVPMFLDNEVIGVIEVLNKSTEGGFSKEDENLLSILANQAAIAVKNSRLAMEQRNFFSHVIEILVKSIESTGLVPEDHCWRVAKWAVAVGKDLDMSDQELQDLYYAAALHDVGFLSLRETELESLELHTTLGAKIVSAIDLLHGTESIIHYHHEYFDGSGYPDGLVGEEIPLGSRIIAVAEEYEELLIKDNSPGVARDYIQSQSGKLFDQTVVKSFLKLPIFEDD
jgi:hypothetical protein